MSRWSLLSLCCLLLLSPVYSSVEEELILELEAILNEYERINDELNDSLLQQKDEIEHWKQKYEDLEKSLNAALEKARNSESHSIELNSIIRKLLKAQADFKGTINDLENSLIASDRRERIYQGSIVALFIAFLIALFT